MKTNIELTLLMKKQENIEIIGTYARYSDYNAMIHLNTEKNTLKTPLKLALAAVFAALVCVATLALVISIPATSGYFNLGETVIYVAALLFGPLVGGTAGGVGAAIADILVAAQFAPGPLIVKGLEGAIVGFLNKKIQKRTRSLSLSATASVIIGGLEMVAGYFIYEQLVLGYPLAVALVEVPFNVVQMLVGLIVAVIIVHVVLRVFPQLKS
ncbi:ECF transporter S component [Candidatus Bathyarchaeota archaeon]|nr:ECF transporter S component [Candidatus Bathyarchaeota archaeon]